MEIEEEIVFSAVTNDSSNGNSTNITHITRPEKATNMEINTTPADDIQKDKDKAQDKEKDKDEVGSSKEENKDKSLDRPDSKNKNKNKNNNKQESHVNT